MAFAALWTVWTLAEFTVALSGDPALFLAMTGGMGAD
jgi:hypothetical protein